MAEGVITAVAVEIGREAPQKIERCERSREKVASPLCLVIVAEASINKGEECKLEEERELCYGLVARKRRGDVGGDRRWCRRRDWGSWSLLLLVTD
ncbi:hypothetical protein AHAS_Ahas10G0148200 [Arachis hypogaea]